LVLCFLAANARVSGFQAKEVLAKNKMLCRFEKGFSAKIKLLGGFERRHLGRDYTFVVDLKKGISAKTTRS
jgi:hypothetical protein